MMLEGHSPHQKWDYFSGFYVFQYLVAFVWVLEGWSHTYEGTSECCKGAEIPPGSAAWPRTHEYHPEEFWVMCLQAPAPNNTSPPGGCCL